MLLMKTGAKRIAEDIMWGFKETSDGGDSFARTWVQSDVGLFTPGPVKVIVPHFKFSTCL